MKSKLIPLLGFLLAACAPERGAKIDFRAAPLKPGGDITFSKEYAGKPALIYVWATWCGPCRQVAPTIEELKLKYAAKGVAFVAVAQDEQAAVRKYESQTPHNLDVVIDSGFSIANVLDTSGIPVIAVVDADHRTVIAEAGVPNDKFASIIAALDAVATK